MVTPAGGGGVVVGDPFDAGRAAPAGGEPERAGRMPDDGVDEAPAVAVPTPAPTRTPKPVATARPRIAADASDDGDEGDAPLANQAVEPGDEALPPRVGALTADKGGFANPRPGFSNREQAEAEAIRSRPGIIVGDEDVDAPPAGSAPPVIPVRPNVGLAGRGGVFPDSGEDFPDSADGGFGVQPAGSIEIKRGSADEVATTFLSLIAAGDLERATPLISGRATGLLARLRDGTATPEQIDELKAAAAARQQENSRSKGGTVKLITYRADKKMILLEAEQKDEDCSVVKLDLRPAPRRRN